MNKTVRLLLGLLSSLFLALGLVRASERLDPLSRQSSPAVGAAAMSPAPGCTNACNAL